jgi:hypothetical protein
MNKNMKDATNNNYKAEDEDIDKDCSPASPPDIDAIDYDI